MTITTSVVACYLTVYILISSILSMKVVSWFGLSFGALLVGLSACSSAPESAGTTALPTTTVDPALAAAADCFNEYLIDVAFIQSAVDYETGFRELALEYGSTSQRHHEVVRLANENYGNSFQFGSETAYAMTSDSIKELCKAAGYDTDLLR